LLIECSGSPFSFKGLFAISPTSFLMEVNRPSRPLCYAVKKIVALRRGNSLPHDTPLPRFLRWLLLLLGLLFTAAGLVGVVLPLLPTTPFLLLAVACFARSSRRCHLWLIGHPLFGPTIRQWQQERTLSRRSKFTAVVLLILSLGSSILFFLQQPFIKLVLLVLGLSLIVFLLRLPEQVKANR
jgi:uncharacterized protein